MSLKLKISLFLIIIFGAIGSVSTFVFIENLKETELSHLREENGRIIAALTKELFVDITVWKENQIIEGPYGFKKGEIKKTQERFIKLFKDITGKNMLLLNIYNSEGRIIASSFSEFEGHTVYSLNDFEVIDVLKGDKDLVRLEKLEEVHPQLYWKRPEGREGAIVLEIFTPIEIDGKIVGVVESYFIQEIELREHIISMGIITGVGILFMLLFIYLFFFKYIIKPLRIIRNATHPVSKGEFANFIKIKQGGNDEIGELANDFNKMIRGLNSLSSEITRLKEVGKMKSEFISIVAHQLRTPLTGIKWVLETISEKELSEETREWFKKVQSLNGRMIKIINDFLNAARIEEGRMSYVFQENVNLIEVLNKVVKAHKIGIERRHLTFSFPQYNSLPVRIRADSEKLDIAFGNLIDNAINYTKENGAVHLELIKKEDFVIVKITDTGIGISEEDLPRLFMRFFRSKKAISIKPAGSGIGLFIVKNIIRSHNGTVHVESQLNNGASFYVKLPFKNKVSIKDSGEINK